MAMVDFKMVDLTKLSCKAMK
ncbi:hypothetical protein A2U01_0112168, partial [Trifolium medium]|nr:hypothetical protein [Trifolium medium]